jgi:hypothetical protein
MTCPAGDFSSQGDEKHNVCDASFCIRKNRIPAFAGMTAKICGITMIVIAALMAMPAMAEGKNPSLPTTQEATDQKTVTSKYYVDQELATKQDTIATDKVLFFDGKGKETSIYVPAIVATNAAGTALSGNTIGVLDYTASTQSVNEHDYDLLEYAGMATADNFVPTVRAVAEALTRISNNTTGNTLNFSTDETTATNNYSVSFNGTTGNWPSNDLDKFVKGSAFAAGLALKQKKIDAGTAGNVVTYTGTAGQVGSANVASDALYSNNTLYNGSDVANIAAVETKQDKMTCAGYLAGHENDEDYCWLYSVAETRQTCTPNSQSCDPSNNTCCSGICNPDKLGNYHCRATPF